MSKVVIYLHARVYINYKDLILYMKTLHSLVNTLFVIYVIRNMMQLHLNIILNTLTHTHIKDDG